MKTGRTSFAVRLAWTGFATLSALTWIPGVLALNLVVNGDFESGNSGFGTEYDYRPGDIWPEGVYDIVSDPKLSHSGAGVSFGDHTTGTGLMMAVNGAERPGRVVWEQTVAVDPSTTYGFSLWYANWSRETVYDLSVLSVLFSGTEVMRVTIPSPAGAWAGEAINWDSGALTSVTIRIVDLDLAANGNDFSLDDIVLGDMTTPGHSGAPDGINQPVNSGGGNVPDGGITLVLLGFAGLALFAFKANR